LAVRTSNRSTREACLKVLCASLRLKDADQLVRAAENRGRCSTNLLGNLLELDPESLPIWQRRLLSVRPPSAPPAGPATPVRTSAASTSKVSKSQPTRIAHSGVGRRLYNTMNKLFVDEIVSGLTSLPSYKSRVTTEQVGWFIGCRSLSPFRI
jgi:hypothetical protein